MRQDSSITAARTIVPAENRLYEIKNNRLLSEFNDNGKSMVRRQDMINSYTVFSADVFRFKGNRFDSGFLGDNIYPIITSKICGIDIDIDIDFEIVKNIMEMESQLINEYL